MMIEDISGSRALMGRPQQLQTGVLTCLSGFIEQVTAKRSCHWHLSRLFKQLIERSVLLDATRPWLPSPTP